MIFPLNIIKKVNNGILSLSNYFNGFSDNNQPIEFVTTLKEIFELYKTDSQYRTEKNKCYLMDISIDLLRFEYTIDKNKVLHLEGTDNEPNDLQQYMETYVDAYNVCCDIHDYFEKLYPNEIYSLDSEQPIILTGADYDYNPPQPIIKPLLEKININTLPDGIYNRLARLDTNRSFSSTKGVTTYGELILPDISYFSDLDFYLLCEWYDSFKRNIKSDKGLYNEKGEKLTLQYDSYKYLFIEFGKGFKKGYSEFENDLKPKTKLFEQDNNQIAFRIFSHVDTYFNVGSFSFNINIDNENMPQYSRYVTPETMFNNGLEWGKQYKAWIIILDNIPLFEQFFDKYKKEPQPIVESQFSVLEWATIFYYADETKLLPENRYIKNRLEQFMSNHQVNTTFDNFKTKYYEAKKRINKKDDYPITKLNLIIPFLKENYKKTVTKVENDINFLENNKSEY